MTRGVSALKKGLRIWSLKRDGGVPERGVIGENTELEGRGEKKQDDGGGACKRASLCAQRKTVQSPGKCRNIEESKM